MQRQKPVADQIDRRLVAGAEQEDDIGGEFLIRELVARFLRLHQVRREVVARLAPAQLEQALEVIRHSMNESILLLDFGGTERSEVEQAATRARAGMEEFSVLLRNTEHLADYGHRQAVGKIGDQVHMPAGLDAIDNG